MVIGDLDSLRGGAWLVIHHHGRGNVVRAGNRVNLRLHHGMVITPLDRLGHLCGRDIRRLIA
eukprot:4221001-Amphidinium_carterae.1